MSHALLGTVVPKTKESENAFSTGCQTSDNKINSSASLEESVINVGVVLVSVRKESFSALAVSIFGVSCAAYIGTPPRNPSISLPGRKMPPFRIENCQ